MQEFSGPGDAVKKARGELGLTQNQVADQIGRRCAYSNEY